MIGKPIKGKSFGGCVRYVVNKKEAEILEAEGVRMQDAASIIHDFNFQWMLNPSLGKAVGHTVLSWSEQDKAKLNDKLMVEIAGKYMKEMGITDTQYLIVKHSDREHPHVHIIFNRVNNEGKTISDQNDFVRNAKVCRQLTEAYRLHIAEGKNQVNRQQLKGNDKVKYEIYDALKQSIPKAHTWQQLEAALKKKGISILYKYKSGTDEVQGVSFEKDGMVFKGSAIDRSMSLVGIEKQLRMNGAIQHEHYQAGKPFSSPTIHQDALTAFDTGIHLTAQVAGLLTGLLAADAGLVPDDVPMWAEQRKKKRKMRR